MARKQKQQKSEAKHYEYDAFPVSGVIEQIRDTLRAEYGPDAEQNFNREVLFGSRDDRW